MPTDNSAKTSMWSKTPAIILDWAELTAPGSSPDLLARLEAAYGYEGLGILAVRGIPGYKEARALALPQAYAFGNLPEDVKKRYVDEKSTFSFGWSHGMEKLEGRPDTAKGSYYNNPIHDVPITDAADIAAYPAFASPNVWPNEADAPGFTGAYKGLAKLIVDVGAQLARHVDSYVCSVEPGYPPAEGLRLHDVIQQCRTHKARLLYYFPVSASETAANNGNSSSSSWCGWHNDHGSLTGLTAAMFFNQAGEEIPCPDPDAGLFIRSRSGTLVQVSVPADCLAFQIGETAQIHSGGVLQATPHCVRAALAAGPHTAVSRGTMAVFMEPEWSHAMACPGLRSGAKTSEQVPPSVSAEAVEGAVAGASATGDASIDSNGSAATEASAVLAAAPDTPATLSVWERVLRGARGELLPPGVPNLARRWEGPGQTFGGFTEKTLGSYY